MFFIFILFFVVLIVRSRLRAISWLITLFSIIFILIFNLHLILPRNWIIWGLVFFTHISLFTILGVLSFLFWCFLLYLRVCLMCEIVITWSWHQMFGVKSLLFIVYSLHKIWKFDYFFILKQSKLWYRFVFLQVIICLILLIIFGNISNSNNYWLFCIALGALAHLKTAETLLYCGLL